MNSGVDGDLSRRMNSGPVAEYNVKKRLMERDVSRMISDLMR
jgi:hypothetical protein